MLMKICYVSNNFEIHDYRFLVKLIENNYDVHAVSFRKNKIPDKYFVDKIKYYEYYKIHTFLTKRYKGLNPFWYYNALKFLKRIIIEIKPDILHGGYTSISGFICALSGSHPFLLMPWGSDILIDPKRFFGNKLLTSYSIRNSDLITCDITIVKDEIVDKYDYDPDKIIVFPWGIDLNKFNPQNNETPDELIEWKNNTIIICTRQHRKIYANEYIIEAIPNILKENNSIRFLFIGSGPLTEKYLKKVNKLKIEEYVKFIPWIDNEKLPLYLSNSDINVSASLSDGSSLCLMEALACGLPSIVSDIKSNRIWIKNGYNGYLCKVKNSRDISEKILCLINNKKKFSKMKTKAINTSKKEADWNKNFSKLEKTYQILLK